MSGTWIFGYGSLVSPESFGFTVGREFRSGVDFFEAELAGYGRRWNYGTSYRFRADPSDLRFDASIEWTFVALGIIAADTETTNGVIGWVADHELAALDEREREYDRVDVTDLTTLAPEAVSTVDGARIAVYVPRSVSVDRYERERNAGRAAVTQAYWDLVDDAFGVLGPDRQQRYRATTPPPDIPVVPQHPDEIPARHRGRRR